LSDTPTVRKTSKMSIINPKNIKLSKEETKKLTDLLTDQKAYEEYYDNLVAKKKASAAASEFYVVRLLGHNTRLAVGQKDIVENLSKIGAPNRPQLVTDYGLEKGIKEGKTEHLVANQAYINDARLLATAIVDYFMEKASQVCECSNRKTIYISDLLVTLETTFPREIADRLKKKILKALKSYKESLSEEGEEFDEKDEGKNKDEEDEEDGEDDEDDEDDEDEEAESPNDSGKTAVSVGDE